MADDRIKREGVDPKVRVSRIRWSGAVQIVGIVSLSLMELVALHNNVDGALVLPLAGLISALVGLNAGKVMEAVGLLNK